MSAAGNKRETNNEGQNSPPTDDQDQILLKALQDLIIRIAGPKKMNERNQIPMGPEAGKLITALREFVTSIAGYPESRAQNTIVEVSLVEEENAHQANANEDAKGALLASISSAKSLEDQSKDYSQHLEPAEKLQPTFQDKLLKALREHVFNVMPIRMISFEPHGSILEIALLERGAIYARLASALQGEMHDVDRVSIVKPKGTWVETEDEAIERLISKHARYAILSHTWLRTSGEITYDRWNKGIFDIEDPGYQKLINFCKVAWKDHGFSLGWMDTVCINKESSSELDESIRSMYKWYSRADVCITYLTETTSLSHMHIDPWFTRGWTLQELLAPDVIKFYNKGWKKLTENSKNDKNDDDILEQIERATMISRIELRSIRSESISRRMQLAATREVTREEDKAYSLMGIFDVSISTAYGEGAQSAFFRLLHEILVSSVDVLDILNWAGALPASRPHASSILPSSPLHYLSSHPMDYGNMLEPLTLTHLGLRVPVVLMRAIFIPNHEVSQFVPIGDYSAYVTISRTRGKNSFLLPSTAIYNLLDKRVSGQDGPFKANNGCQVALAVFNISGWA